MTNREAIAFVSGVIFGALVIFGAVMVLWK